LLSPWRCPQSSVLESIYVLQRPKRHKYFEGWEDIHI
jgi:hypothetical protein